MSKVFRFLTRKLRKTPDFLLIGGSKCGTTTLYNYLIHHPQIATPLVKEIHFFSYKYSKGLDWYKMFFPLKTTNKMVFEASTSYLTDDCAPDNIAEAVGAAKFLVLLRDPLAKAVSLWNQRFGIEDHYPFLESPYLQYYLGQAEYHRFIKNWFVWFEPTRFLFIKSEDLFKSPHIVFQSVCRFLYIKFKAVKPRKDNVKDSIVTEQIQASLGEYFTETKKEVAKLTGIKW